MATEKMTTWYCYSGSIRMGTVEAKDLPSAMNKGRKKFGTTVWVRPKPTQDHHQITQ